ncbi:MAG: prepilin-type N-terminal cleavage/methylation domain-containing protein [Candidatus Paceibacteria bacterium]|jgi:prepilin-type N-terminal cleavage/methylation domain-containing protein
MKYNLTQNGFSLVETLVAISILLIVITGPMAISATTARSVSFSSEQVTAFFLAQEGAEIAQKARDDLLLENFPADLADVWDYFVNDSGGDYDECFTGNGCGLELNTDSTGSLKAPVSCSGTNCKLYYDDSAFTRASYTHTEGANETTVYTRVIKFEVTEPDREVRIESKVTWRTGSQRAEQEVVVETYLFNVYGS